MRVGSRRRDDRSRTQCESPPIQPASAVRTTASPRTRTPRSALRELPVGRRAALSARRSITAAPSSLRSRPTRGWSLSHLVRCDSESALARRPQPRSLSVPLRTFPRRRLRCRASPPENVRLSIPSETGSRGRVRCSSPTRHPHVHVATSTAARPRSARPEPRQAQTFRHLPQTSRRRRTLHAGCSSAG
jgi:hypothetical protein